MPFSICEELSQNRWRARSVPVMTEAFLVYIVTPLAYLFLHGDSWRFSFTSRQLSFVTLPSAVTRDESCRYGASVHPRRYSVVVAYTALDEFLPDENKNSFTREETTDNS